MLLNSVVVVFVHRRVSFRTLPLPPSKKNAPTIIYVLSERWTRLSCDTDFSFTIEPTRCAAPRRVGPKADSRSKRTRDDKSSPRARAEGRTSDSLADLVKIRKLLSAHLQSITAFPAAGARPSSSSRIICFSRARRISRFDFVLCVSRAPRVGDVGRRNAS